MKTEFEAKFFPISQETFRALLHKVGAHLKQEETLMRRVIYQLADKKWLRVRDEGNKTTITIKEIINHTAIDGVREIEINADDFQKAKQLFDTLGLAATSYQENYRETWELHGAMITIDTWPGLDPFVEIEGESAGQVKIVIKILGLKEQDAQYGAIDTLYHIQYGISNQVFNSITQLTFDTIDSVLYQLKNSSLTNNF